MEEAVGGSDLRGREEGLKRGGGGGGGVGGGGGGRGKMQDVREGC